MFHPGFVLRGMQGFGLSSWRTKSPARATLGICSWELLRSRSQPEEGWGRERQASPSSTAEDLQ